MRAKFFSPRLLPLAYNLRFATRCYSNGFFNNIKTSLLDENTRLIWEKTKDGLTIYKTKINGTSVHLKLNPDWPLGSYYKAVPEGTEEAIDIEALPKQWTMKP